MLAMMPEDPLYNLDEIIRLKRYKNVKQHVLGYASSFFNNTVVSETIMNNQLRIFNSIKNCDFDMNIKKFRPSKIGWLKIHNLSSYILKICISYYNKSKQK